jgi:uncharacterized protein YcnI
MIRTLLQRSAVVAAVAALPLALSAAPASAHVTVGSPAAVQGGYATVTFKVPTESDTAATTKLEVNLPTDTPFASVSLRPVPGWTGTAEKADGAKTVSKITWTASGDAAIKPGQFQNFDVSLGPLPTVDKVVFKALQTYSDGTVVRWIEEPATDGSEVDKPAPTLKLAPAAEAPTQVPVAAPAETEGDGNGTPYGIAGIVLGLAGLVLGLLAYRRAGRGTATAPARSADESVRV